MTIITYRSIEPLFILIYKNQPQAEKIFKSWAQENRIDYFQINGNRMMLYDQYSFEKFKITWNTSIDNIIIWDNWNKRHIYFD
jgi:hypothetical protein